TPLSLHDALPISPPMSIETGFQHSRGYRILSPARSAIPSGAQTVEGVIQLVPECLVPWGGPQTKPERRPCRTARSGRFLVHTQLSWQPQDATGPMPFPSLEH